jgi:toxin ParE1/3/4
MLSIKNIPASADIEEIWLYICEKWSIEQSDRYFNLIIKEIEYIIKYPRSGKDYSEIRKGYFRSKVKSHFNFYRVNSKENTIEIIRILHQRMDINSRLSE